MPFKDREKQRAAERECQRRRRAGAGTLARQTRVKPELAELRLATAKDAVELLRAELERIMRLVKGKDPAQVMARARTVAGLLATWLRVVEIAEILPRLEALEEAAAKNEHGLRRTA